MFHVHTTAFVFDNISNQYMLSTDQYSCIQQCSLFNVFDGLCVCEASTALRVCKQLYTSMRALYVYLSICVCLCLSFNVLRVEMLCVCACVAFNSTHIFYIFLHIFFTFWYMHTYAELCSVAILQKRKKYTPKDRARHTNSRVMYVCACAKEWNRTKRTI